MFRASVDNFQGYAHHAYAGTEDEARERLCRYLLVELEKWPDIGTPLSTLDQVVEYFGVNTEPVLEGVFCESHPEHNLEG